ncbi:HAMP domain-containing sensor histidine kinase [Alcanivorax sp. 1008]|uniref:sensor histidine kinase n=1 Tax=Alcanivorax sp. 1008 TaxID=2816853 RepID=UPI001DDAA0EC|nr:HAMP domain-containing sensor histidine kinase [Alcanivorax sp. 1008]MCC1495467.1 HAMP domain-containing histidine kinase [Alcanivorax sp. 1008]
MRRAGLQYRLTRAYLLQMVLISFATLFGVWVTAQIIERVLVRQALVMEAEHFWDAREQQPDIQRPNTRHLLGLIDGPGGDAIPQALRGLSPGEFVRVELDGNHPIVYAERRGQETLYLIFDEQRVSMLAFVFGILPLSGVLLVIYIGSFMTWRKSRKLVSPLVQLAELLRRTPVNDPRAARPDLSVVEAEADSEVAVLVVALEAYANRLVGFVERERQFTRDASHELRTPLAVIRANLELLSGRQVSPEALRRIEDTVGDMEALIETLLLLARSESRELPDEELIVNDLVCNLVERLEALAQRKNVGVRVEQSVLLMLRAPETVLTMVLTNLIRNAINYTGSGHVTISIDAGSLVVQDTGPGMDPSQLQRLMQPFERGQTMGESGHGLGLAIVQRLCERCRWKLEVASALGQGTSVRVTFPFWQRH